MVASLGGQVAVLAVLAWLGAPVLMPRLAPLRSSLLHLELAPPPVTVHHPPPPHIRIPPPPRELARVSPPAIPPPREEIRRPVVKPVVPQPVVKTPPVERPVPAPKPAVKAPVRPTPPPVRMGIFSAGSSAKPTLNRPAREVQTGGFGAPSGVNSHAFGPANVPKLGAFGMPEGPGKGNGSGGAKGTPGVVPSAGFGNGIAVRRQGSPKGVVSGVGFGDGLTSNQPSGPRGTVQSSGFGAQASPAARQKRPQAGAVTPLEVLYKPRPAYTPEARQLHLQGTVLLSAVFEASGQVRVLRVVRGLGHGLDQSAIDAARQIRFKPEQRNGHPVNLTATLAIVFQLAY